MFVTGYSWNVRCDLTRVTPHQRWHHGALFSCLSIGLIYPHFSYRNVVDPAISNIILNVSDALVRATMAWCRAFSIQTV